MFSSWDIVINFSLLILALGIIFLSVPARRLILYPRMQRIASLLDNAKINCESFRYWEVQGEYKGRIISVEDSFGETRRQLNGFYIRPQFNASREKLFIFNYPHPTKHTTLMQGRIRYNFLSIGAVNEYFLSKKGIIQILEDLTRAAEKVEKNLPYYDQTGSRSVRFRKFLMRNFLNIFGFISVIGLILALMMEMLEKMK